MKENIYRKFLARNILLTHEVAERLNISRQRMSILRKEGELIPVKSTSNGSVYLLQDLMQYMERKGLLPAYENRRQPKFICESSNPMDNVNYFKENIKQMGEVERVSIFFEAMDAAIENYFLVLDEDRYGELTVLSIPYMIIADVNGEEMWLYGCSCGYPGAGPNASVDILKGLGLADKLVKNVFKYPLVKYIKNDAGKWEVHARGTDFASYRQDKYREARANMYWHQGRLTLIQEDRGEGSKSIDVLERYWAFIPNPTEYILFADDIQAVDHGFYNPIGQSRSGTGAYRLIIRDYTGRQLWLNPQIAEDRNFDKQSELRDILEACGFAIEEDGLLQNLARWFQLPLDRIDPAKPMTGQRNPFWG